MPTSCIESDSFVLRIIYSAEIAMNVVSKVESVVKRIESDLGARYIGAEGSDAKGRRYMMQRISSLSFPTAAPPDLTSVASIAFSAATTRG